jgi:ribosomal protein L11 methyltransferase
MFNVFEYPVKNKKMIISNGAFGSGEHETTKGCLKLIEMIDIKGFDVLDIGCGTGILSIYSSLLGAKKVVGFDISKDACKTCLKNCHMNDVKNVYVVCSANSAINGKFDLILANIYIDIVIDLLPFNYKRLKENRFLILSGIPIEESYQVSNLYEQNGFKCIKSLYHTDFVSMLFKKS